MLVERGLRVAVERGDHDDRAQLAAENGYVGVSDLPEDVRTEFVASHRDLQAQVNALIGFMGSECDR